MQELHDIYGIILKLSGGLIFVEEAFICRDCKGWDWGCGADNG